MARNIRYSDERSNGPRIVIAKKLVYFPETFIEIQTPYMLAIIL